MRKYRVTYKTELVGKEMQTWINAEDRTKVEDEFYIQYPNYIFIRAI